MIHRSGIVAFLLIIAALKLCAQSGSSNLEFVENKGQWDKSIKFKADISTGSFYLHQNGFTVILNNPEDVKRLQRPSHGLNKTKGTSPNSSSNGKSSFPDTNEDGVIHSHAYRVSFENANDKTIVVADKALPTYNNYFIGNDPSKWASKCKVFQGVTYKNIYPNIDARYYTDNGVLKYNLIVHPGGDPNRISMKYDGSDKMAVKRNQLQITTSVGVTKENIPSSYQLNNEGKKEVECNYELSKDNHIHFRVKNYNPDATLVIDPTLVFSSFTGSSSDNWGFTATYGPDGSLFAGGIVAGNGFHTTVGSFQTNFRGGTWDVGIMKFSPDGTKRIFATYIGGTGNEYPHSLIVDPQGELVVYGRTSSPDFPAITKIGPGGANVVAAGRNIYVAKFTADGSNLIGSILIGGSQDDGVNIEDQDETASRGNNTVKTEELIQNYGDWSRGEVILDGAGNIYLASCTQSPDFPIIGSVFQPAYTAGGTYHQDGVVVKINSSCNAVIFSTFIGGTGDDAALVLDQNPLTTDIYVGGSTTSKDLPGVLGNAYQGSSSDAISGFISEITQDGTTLKATSYLSTNGNAATMIYGVKFDKFGFPYVMGTTSGKWPTKLLNPPTDFINAGAKQFIAKLQPDLSAVVYSTTFGSNAGKPNISPVAFLVDRCENVYISGWGAFYEAPTTGGDPYNLAGTKGMPVTADALKTVTDNRDFYFIVIQRDAASLLYATFFGEDDNGNDCCSEHVDGGTSRFDKNGVIYQAICANCYGDGGRPFPTTPGAWSRVNGAATAGSGAGCNLAGVKISFNFSGVIAAPKPLINGVEDSTGCVPLVVEFEDTIRNGKTYIWNFGDGTPDSSTSLYSVTHSYDNIGNYLVRLIAVDSNSCNIRDTAYLHIRARNDKAVLGFNTVKLPPCQSLSYQFNNVSTAPGGKPFKDSSFIWDFGDGTVLYSGPSSITHSYLSPGTYTIRLLLVDTNYCNFPDSSVQKIYLSPLAKAQFTTPASGCAPYNAIFNNITPGQQNFWDFGDGTTSTDPSPVHLYQNAGSYTIKLIVIDNNTCNITDSTTLSIVVSDKPHAAFTTSPVPPIVNTPTVFNNNSTGGILFNWYFGDGDSATRTTTDTVIHQYQSNGPFQACLIVTNQFQCTDTACNSVSAIIQPLLDVPNAFTPGRFGENSVVKVRGFGISKLVFRIYNRWGQKVFESNDINLGWDGNFNGTPQPMDVYAYVLEVEYSNGTKAGKKGDITLIR